MAHNPYDQAHWQQLPPQDQTPVGHYGGQTQAHRTGQLPRREDVQHTGDNRWNGHNGYNAPRGNGMRNGYMPDPYENVNRSYTGSGYNGPVTAAPQGPGQGQGQGRVYQYNESDGRSRQNARNHGGGEVLMGDTRQRAQSKPRERILERPSSPEAMAWDSPFPTFNSKKKQQHKKNHSSLDRELGNLSLQEYNPQEPRPHTSQGTRLRAHPRPSTAHDYQRPGREPLPSPAFSQQPQAPFRKELSRGFDRGYDSDSQQWRSDHVKGSGRPDLNPLHPNGYEQTTSGFPNQTFPDLERPMQRSMTMPESVSPGGYERAVPNFSVAKSYWPEAQGQSQYGGQRVRPQASPHVDPGQRGPAASMSRSVESGQPAAQHDRTFPGQYSGNQEYEQQTPYEDSFQNQSSREPRGIDMPKFNAIAAPPSEKFEDHLQPVQNQTPAPPAYTKKTYQPPQQALEQPHQSQSQRDAHQGGQGPQSLLAEFQFGLPRAEPNVSEDQHASSRQQQQHPIPSQDTARQPSLGSGQYDQYQQQHGYEDYHQPEQDPGPMPYFPPGNASRPHLQQRSVSGGPRYPTEEPPLRQERNFGSTQQPPLNNHDRFYDRSKPDAHQHGGAAYDQTGYANRGQPPSLHDYRGVGGQLHGDETRPDRQQQEGLTRKSHEYDAAQILPTGSFLHPPPVRQYDQRGVSSSIPGPTNRPIGPRSPDSLPMHPTPVRPGLINHGAGEQQAGTATPQQSLASATQPLAMNGKQKSPPVTCQELSMLQEQVRTNPNDHATALKLAKTLEEAVSVLANEGGRVDAKTTAKNREKYSFDAHRILKKLVSVGYPEAMFYLADCYGQGKLGLEVDPKEAFSLYQSAAKANHAQSAYRVAVCCEMGAEEGGGTRRDPQKAIQWYRRAATLGDPPAMYKMGMILLKGLLGQPKNTREALSWLNRAAERADEENPHALHELGLLYESATPTDAIIRDENYSRQLFTQAAELGYKYSQFRLGSAYEYGMLGCPVDARQSIAWYSRAAAQGEHQSELALSGWYLTGAEGLIQQSDAEAYLWARKAASTGFAKAEFAMGYFTEVGIGTPANMDEAKKWYWRAASHNFAKAKERLDELKKGGGKMPNRRVSRSAVSKHGEGECLVM